MKHLRTLLAIIAAAALTWSFWHSAGWLQLCAGLAIFLFGMRCLEEGLRQLAGSRLEQWLARSTGTPVRGLLFGMGGTVLLQSSTLVSLMTIAFISSGLIQLAGGIAVIFGANLGATSGIWLLALAGHDFSLSPLALPLLVFGVLAGFGGERKKAVGRIVLGVAFILLGIDQIKTGFAAFGQGLGITAVQSTGVAATLAFVAVGALATMVLQSSHATLMITLAALAAGRLEIGQSLAIAIGANVGSSVSTAVVGSLGGNRAGQRLALAHVLFNGTTAAVALLLLPVLTGLVRGVAGVFGFGANALLQLALFHTVFNGLGVALFWPWQARLAGWLVRWLPDRPAPGPAAAERASHLSEQALGSLDAATAAVTLELRHLGRVGREIACEALHLPASQLEATAPDEALVAARPPLPGEDADVLYQRRLKAAYGELLGFMGRLELPMDEAHQRYWARCQVAAVHLVDAVRDARHLQRNLATRLAERDSPLRTAYVDLRRHLMAALQTVDALSQDGCTPQRRHAALQVLDEQSQAFEAAFRTRLSTMARRQELDALQLGSLMNDLNHATRLYQGLRDAIAPADEPQSLRQLRELAGHDEARVPPAG